MTGYLWEFAQPALLRHTAITGSVISAVSGLGKDLQ